MTAKDFDALIQEIIIPQIKPRNTRNSYFRKIGDKRRLSHFISLEKLKNPAQEFFNRFIGQSYSDYVYFNFYGASYIGGNGGVRYNSLTGRLKLYTNCESRRKVKTRRLIKRLQRRNPRKFKGYIANGAAYKKLHLNSTY